MLSAFAIILFYKIVWWFDGQDIGVEPRKLRFQHILSVICIYLVHVCKCIVSRWVVDR
jgi:hypothetical protein